MLRMALSVGIAVAMAAPVVAAPLQADYEAATAELANGNAAEAAAKFEALLKRLSPAALANPRHGTAAIARAGLGRARAALGEYRTAIPMLEQAAAALPTRTPEEKVNLAETLLALARSYEQQADYAAARAVLQRALGSGAYPPGDMGTLRLQVALVRNAVFEDPRLAIETTDAILPMVEYMLGQANGEKAKLVRDRLAEVYSLRGRVHLNRGEHAEALRWFDQALKVAGGLTLGVSAADTRIRGDLAIVHHLLGNETKVKRYLAYTGAGRGDGDIGRGADMQLPACGETTGLARDDMAIIEFGIDDGGRVIGATPIYATRPAATAPFVRAVAGWSWEPAAAKALNPFWRSAVRLELRCSNDAARPSLSGTLQAALDRWQSTAGIALPTMQGSEAELVPPLRAELAARTARHGAEAIEVVPALIALATLKVTPPDEATELLTRASRIAWQRKLPLEVRILTEVSRQYATAMSQTDRYEAMLRAYRLGLAALLDRLRKDGEDSTRSGAFVRMELAEALGTDIAAAEPLYRAVVALPASALPEADPIRQAALLQLATLAAAKGAAAEAQQLVAATGLSPDQCALADVQPLKVAGRLTSNDFPNEALRWGFAGWVSVSYDIDVAGRPLAPRAVMAYPPFVFGDATTAAIKRFRFQPLPRSAGNVGCTDRLQVVRYLYPKS